VQRVADGAAHDDGWTGMTTNGAGHDAAHVHRRGMTVRYVWTAQRTITGTTRLSAVRAWPGWPGAGALTRPRRARGQGHHTCCWPDPYEGQGQHPTDPALGVGPGPALLLVSTLLLLQSPYIE
jgi:hypothetical protein